MDVFSRTFLPATSEAGLPIPLVSRHMPLVRRCVTPDEHTVLVARCHRPGQPLPVSLILLLTNRNLIITRESRLLHRVQLYLAAGTRTLRHVTWTSDRRSRAIELAATTPGGVRERFWIPIDDARNVQRLHAMFRYVFQPAGTMPPADSPVPPPRVASPAGAV